MPFALYSNRIDTLHTKLAFLYLLFCPIPFHKAKQKYFTGFMFAYCTITSNVVLCVGESKCQICCIFHTYEKYSIHTSTLQYQLFAYMYCNCIFILLLYNIIIYVHRHIQNQDHFLIHSHCLVLKVKNCRL